MSQYAFKTCRSPNESLTIKDSPRTTLHHRADVGWVLLGGTVLFEARDTSVVKPEFHAIRIVFNDSKNSWTLEDDQHSPMMDLPEDTLCGSLHEIMQEFQKRTGLDLPTLALHHVGVGIERVSSGKSDIDQKNPWLLKVGQTYEVDRARGKGPSLFKAAPMDGHVGIYFVDDSGEILSDTISPALLEAEAWASVRHHEEPPRYERQRA
jgi:hypothetical protein